jgi:hypothetical protein
VSFIDHERAVPDLKLDVVECVKVPRPGGFSAWKNENDTLRIVFNVGDKIKANVKNIKRC